ncbi:hypothetical protein [Actinoalloteichus hymeniacidonis]|uniref:Uncharacterized protein n=1 Tax=Actinoalloteichus hymeniacidonis TaxID=340345 RepID=A0AAC9MZE3_9PSEU|nr:hypothetical protein [Actinoalloteichus hymeniacidonis]AOS63871.1 hypothetical protein TL08_15310 [Actinoalloteichus hymeniacidonis]MBB5908073.1 hypothetical protein [Actinoalloteichus hymeniacidonis]
MTNHLLHRYPDAAALPDDNADTHETYQRMRILDRETRRGEAAVSSPTAMRALLAEVAPTADPEWRAIWHSVIDVDERSLTAGFYLGESDSGTIRHSEEIRFPVRNRLDSLAALDV